MSQRRGVAPRAGPRLQTHPKDLAMTASPFSRWLQYLPAIYQGNDFLARFLRIFETLFAPVEDVADHPHDYFDPRLAPPDFLPWLASWVDLVLDENWPEARRRALIRRGVELYRWRGTARGLKAYLKIYTNLEPEIIEHLTPEDGGPFRFTVVLRPGPHDALDEARVRAIIEAEKPAHTAYTLRIERAR